MKEIIKMKFDALFDQRSLVASKLKLCIRDKGYTKVSFAKKTGISLSALDRLLNGNINRKSTFDRHLQKVLNVLNMSVDELVFYPAYVPAAYSQNTPESHEINNVARKQYDLLMDIIDLCAIYY